MCRSGLQVDLLISDPGASGKRGLKSGQRQVTNWTFIHTLLQKVNFIYTWQIPMAFAKVQTIADDKTFLQSHPHIV